MAKFSFFDDPEILLFGRSRDDGFVKRSRIASNCKVKPWHFLRGPQSQPNFFISLDSDFRKSPGTSKLTNKIVNSENNISIEWSVVGHLEWCYLCMYDPRVGSSHPSLWGKLHIFRYCFEWNALELWHEWHCIGLLRLYLACNRPMTLKICSRSYYNKHFHWYFLNNIS